MPSISPTLSENAKKLAAYFEAFNSKDEVGWERVFDETWHPEVVLESYGGLTLAEFKQAKRGALGKMQIENFEVLRNIDPDQFEYQTVAGGKPSGVKRATFKEGKVVRVADVPA